MMKMKKERKMKKKKIFQERRKLHTDIQLQHLLYLDILNNNSLYLGNHRLDLDINRLDLDNNQHLQHQLRVYLEQLRVNLKQHKLHNHFNLEHLLRVHSGNLIHCNYILEHSIIIPNQSLFF